MNDGTKYRDRWLAGTLISRLLKKTGLSAKAGGAWGAVGITAAVVGGMYGIDLVLDETIPIPTPTPIVEPVAPPPVIVNVNVGEHETSTPAALPEWDEASPHQTPTPATAPALIEEEPEWTPTPIDQCHTASECLSFFSRVRTVDCQPRCHQRWPHRGRIRRQSHRKRDRGRILLAEVTAANEHPRPYP